MRERVQAYATGFYRKRDGDPIQYLVAEAAERVSAACSAIKLKLGFGINEDVRLCQAARKAIGDGSQKIIRIEQSKGRKDRNVMLHSRTRSSTMEVCAEFPCALTKQSRPSFIRVSMRLTLALFSRLGLWSDADLREYVLSGTAEDWAEIKRRFTREQLEELKLALFPPPVPTAEQAAALIERIASATSETWLRQLRVKAAGWDIAIRGAIDARLAELRRTEPRRPYFFQPVDRGWVSPPVDRASPDRPQAVSVPTPRPAGGDAGPTVGRHGLSWGIRQP